jgi:capsular polysaccharide biosynthesis protein
LALDAQVKAHALLASDQAKLKAIEGELSTLHDQIGAGSIALNVARIRRDRDNAEAAYTTIATRLATVIADRAEAASVGSVVVIDRAQVAQKSSMATMVAIGILVLALWLAVTLAVMLENAGRRFRDEVAVESIYGTPVIGKIPSTQRLTPSNAFFRLLGTRRGTALGTVDQ